MAHASSAHRDGLTKNSPDRQGCNLHLRDEWAFFESPDRTVAKQLNDPAELELTGVLHDALRGDAGLLSLFDHLQPTAQEALVAWREEARAHTLQTLLKGSGWDMLFVELTGQCNERCAHCYASASPEVTAALEWELIRSVIDDAAELGFSGVQFSGGDPFLSPHLLSGIGRARERGIPRIEIYTNGLALKAPLARELARLGVCMAFSVYSHDSQRHDAVTRTPGSHRRTLRAIGYALDAGIEVRVGVIVREENQGDAQRVRDLLLDLGVPAHQVGVDRERPVGRGRWQEGAPLQKNVNRNVHAAHPRQPGSGKLAVLYTGRVAPCIFDRETVLGTVTTDGGLRSILETPIRVRSPARLSALQVVTSDAPEPLACTDCRARRSLLSQLSW